MRGHDWFGISVKAGILAVAAATLMAQTPSTIKPAFGVISVKPDRSGGPPGRTGMSGDRFIAENVPLILLILYAYRGTAPVLSRSQVSGDPGWLSTDRFDVEAKVESDIRVIPTQQAWLMVQSLLEDRFKLRVHWENREMPVYNLVAAKGGVKMKPSADQSLPRYDDDAEDAISSGDLRGEFGFGPAAGASGETVISGTAIPISPNPASRRAHALLPHSLLEILWGNSGRPVIDKTGLKGLYDFRLHFSPNPSGSASDATPDNPAGPSVFSAVEQQLGLKLQPAKGPVRVLVIDSVQQPLPN